MNVMKRISIAAALVVVSASTTAAQVAALHASAEQRKTAHAPQRFSLTLDGNISDYSAAASEQAYGASLSYKIRPRTTIFGGFTQYNNFDVVDAQVQAGVTHVFSPRALVTASFTQGVGADVVAGTAVDLKLSGRASSHFEPFVEYNLSRYPKVTKPGFPSEEIDEQTITAGAEMPFNAKTSLTAAYQYSHATDREGAHGMSAFVTHQATPKLSVHLGGSYAGAERLVTVSTFAFLRHSETSGGSAGFSWQASKDASISFTYQYLKVHGFEHIQQFSPSLTWKF